MGGLKIFIVLILISSVGKAQSAGDFEQAGENLFLQLSSPGEGSFVPLIRINQYRELIRRQEWDAEKILKRTNQIDQSYGSQYIQWQETILSLQKEYAKALMQGAELKYLHTRYFPVAFIKDTYDVETTFIFRTSKMQNEVVLKYQLGWIPQYGLHLMSTVEEGF